jgi:nucleoside-diphosphate-sugar epimerase
MGSRFLMKVVICGAGGFIGGHLVDDLVLQGHSVTAVDIKPFHEWFNINPDASSMMADLRLRHECFRVLSRETDWVFNLAADMGGMGFIETHKADCMLSVLISTHMLDATQRLGIPNYFYSSSACVYAADRQLEADVTALKESDAYPAMPEDGYGWEKLFSERMCRHFREDYGVNTRVARFHNVYGPRGSYDGGREKAPAAISRKVIEAMRGNGEIEIWGDGEQTRSFMYIDDCVEGIQKIAFGDYLDPLNLGSNELVSINQLVDIVEDIAGFKCKRSYKLDAPLGVRGRNSDNSLIKSVYGWEPSISLRDGMEKTYKWIYDEMSR